MAPLETPRKPGDPAVWSSMWGNCGRVATGDRRASRPLGQRPQVLHFPLALVDAAGLALEPGLVTLAHVARQEVAAGEAVLVVGGRDRRDGAARAGARVLPRDAGIPAAAAEHVVHGGLGDHQVRLGRLPRFRMLRLGQRARQLGLFVIAEKAAQLVAAAPGREAQEDGGRQRGAAPERAIRERRASERKTWAR